MSLPLFLVDELPADSSFELGGAEGRHAAAVQRLAPGEELLLSDGRGGFAAAVVRAAGKSTLSLTINSRGYAESPSPRIVVAQGIPKGDRGELAVQAMTETGVDEIIPWAASRSIAVWRGERGDKSRSRWEATAREAAKQSRRFRIPPIGEQESLKQLAARAERATAAFVLHEEATERLATVALPSAGEILLIIGPEGGIDNAELAALPAATPVRLGASVLRTSTAGVAALAVLSTRLARW